MRLNLRLIAGGFLVGVVQTMAISLSAQAASAGSLAGSVSPAPTAVYLTDVGAQDWTHWGLTTASTINRKSSVPRQIGDLTLLGTAPGRFGRDPSWARHRWTDGTPTPSRLGFSGGIYFEGDARGYRLRVPAGTTQQTLRLYMGGWASTSRLEARLSDGSAVPYVVKFGGVDVYSREATLTFRAASNGRTLTVRHTRVGEAGNIALQAAALSTISQSPDEPNMEPPAAGGVFPANNFWNTRIDQAPLHPRSADLMANWMHAGHPLHMDFGTVYNGHYNGIPINRVGNATPRRVVTYHRPNYSDESDPMPPEGLPIPDGVKIEGDPQPWAAGADHHMILWDTDNNRLHELYSVRNPSPGVWTTGQYSTWDLNSNALRPLGWTSADVAGLPIMPGLVRYDEAASGEINHALRFTLDLAWGQAWPARHPGTSGDPRFPAMGQRVRLKADVDITKYYGTETPTSPINRTLLQAMKTYGLILADHAGDWFIQGEPDPRWNDDELHLLVYFPPTLFEVVDNESLMIDPDSGESRQ